MGNCTSKSIVLINTLARCSWVFWNRTGAWAAWAGFFPELFLSNKYDVVYWTSLSAVYDSADLFFWQLHLKKQRTAQPPKKMGGFTCSDAFRILGYSEGRWDSNSPSEILLLGLELPQTSLTGGATFIKCIQLWGETPCIYTPWKINGWNLQITHEKKGTWSEPNLQGIMFQPLIFQGCKLFGGSKKANPKSQAVSRCQLEELLWALPRCCA